MRSLLASLVLATLALAGCQPRGPNHATTPTKPGNGGDTRTGTDVSAAPDPNASPSDRDRDNPAPRGGGGVKDLGEIKSEVVGTSTTGEPILETYNDRSLLDDGNDLMVKGNAVDARARYDKLLAEFPDSPLASTALYNIALLHEQAREWEQAFATYADLVARYQTGRDVIDAAMRIGALHAELEHYQEAEVAIDAVLARNDLTHADRIEAFARKGFVVMEQGELDRAETTLREAIAIYGRAARIEDPYYIAMAHYYLGQVEHRRFIAAPLRAPLEQLEKDVAASAAIATRAYDRYLEALDFKQAYWATASGYQMSQLFKELWDAAVRAPIPLEVAGDARPFYVERVHALVRSYLEKSLLGHQKNVELADAFGTTTAWSDASRRRADEIARILARESSGELVIPPAPAHAASTYVPSRIDL